ncbi:hypothetical protein [Deinococcus sonorensis]|uniref:Uncharacterized protein n=1 Tax=Deinococcus sonorensis TaxID=309891 RepID=A0ABV8Y8I9_9DEIO
MMRIREVRYFPLEEVWSDQGGVSTECKGPLGTQGIKRLLAAQVVHFVIADVGAAFTWIPVEQRFPFWKNEVRPHLIEPAQAEQGFRLDELPDNYGYVASEWMWSDGVVIVLCKYH